MSFHTTISEKKEEDNVVLAFTSLSSLHFLHIHLPFLRLASIRHGLGVAGAGVGQRQRRSHAVVIMHHLPL